MIVIAEAHRGRPGRRGDRGDPENRGQATADDRHRRHRLAQQPLTGIPRYPAAHVLSHMPHRDGLVDSGITRIGVAGDPAAGGVADGRPPALDGRGLRCRTRYDRPSRWRRPTFDRLVANPGESIRGVVSVVATDTDLSIARQPSFPGRRRCRRRLPAVPIHRQCATTPGRRSDTGVGRAAERAVFLATAPRQIHQWPD